MAKVVLRNLRVASSLVKAIPSDLFSFRSPLITQGFIFSPSKHSPSLNTRNPLGNLRNFSHGTVNLVISQGKAKFETHEVDPPKKYKWVTKKRLKVKRKKEKEKRKAANRNDPRSLTVKGNKKKRKFANAEERIKYKLDKAKIKEALLVERLKRYEVPKAQGPVVKPHELTGEERFYMKRTGQKRSNYVPIGRRGIFGGVILNMHMHWKKHETVKVICNSTKPGQLQEFTDEIARLSGGFPVQMIGEDTVIFYRGKDYVMPKVMSPIDTLSKKKALEKSKFEQSLESVRRFIAISEKELELYYRHIALYGDPSNRSPLSILDSSIDDSQESIKHEMLSKESHDVKSDSDTESDYEFSDISASESDSNDAEHSFSSGMHGDRSSSSV